MPSRYYERNFVPGCYYHIYNRGAHQRLIFHDASDYTIFTQILNYYLTHPLGTPPSVLIRTAKENKVPFFAKDALPTTTCYHLLAYCLMPNHFHLMLKQIDEKVTLSNLMRRLSVAYAMYYNTRYHHSGTILQGKYKNVLIENEMQWLYLTKYIHRNPLHNQQSSVLCKNVLANYPYSSYPVYLGINQKPWIHSEEILDRYQDRAFSRYQDFVEDAEVGPIEKLTLDSDQEQ